MMQSHEHEYRRLESIIDAANERIRELEAERDRWYGKATERAIERTAANERIRELTDAFEDAENRIIELREVSGKLERALGELTDRAENFHAADIHFVEFEAAKAAIRAARATLAEVAALRKKDRE